jgi:hypothetical protein
MQIIHRTVASSVHPMGRCNMNYLLEVLQQFPHWVRWEYEWKLKPGKEPKLKKPPYSMRTGRKAWVNRPSDWCQYVNWLPNNLGFVLTRECNFICIDIDNKANDPTLVDLHRRILADFADTYIEVSPSGGGLHIWLRGTFGQSSFTTSIGITTHTDLEKSGYKYGDIGVEFYCNARYMTVTFNPLPNHNIPLTDGTERVGRWISECNRLTGKTETCKPPQRHISTGCGGWGCMYADRPNIYALQRQALTPSDIKLFKTGRRAKNGRKFVDLCEGRWEKYYPPNTTESEADLGLMSMIAFYSVHLYENDPVQVARFFLHTPQGKSMISRKANPADNLWRTVDTALSSFAGGA